MTSLLSQASQTFTRALLSHKTSAVATRAYTNRALPTCNQAIHVFPSALLRRPTLPDARTFSSSSVSCAKKYKLKTNHAAAARWKALANRLYKRRKQGKAHGNVKKTPAQLNRLGQAALAVPYHVRHLKRLLPYA